MTSHASQIELLLDVRRYREAEQLISAAMVETPDDPNIHYLAAHLARQLDDNARARAHVHQTLAVDPAHLGARLLLFLDYREQRRYADAEAVIQDLIRESPEDPEFYAWYGDLLLFTAHLEKAETLLREGQRLDPSNDQVRRLYVLLAALRSNHEAANEQLATMVRDDPESRAVAFLLLQVLMSQDRDEEALDLGQELLRAEPENENLVEALISLKANTHWLGWPAYPLRKGGWAASAGMWLAFIVGLSFLRRFSNGWATAFVVVYLVYVIYSWLYQPVLRAWLRRRGFR